MFCLVQLELGVAMVGGYKFEDGSECNHRRSFSSLAAEPFGGSCYECFAERITFGDFFRSVEVG